jgi:hypothetical protein
MTTLLVALRRAEGKETIIFVSSRMMINVHYGNWSAWAVLAAVVTTCCCHPPHRVVDALAPPHPDWTDYESVHEMRRRLDIQYGYEPQHLPEEQCRYLTEAECQMEDRAVADAKAGRHGRYLSPSVGTKLRVLVLLIRFPNHKARNLPTREYFEELFNGSKTDEVNPVGSIAEYLRFSSLGMYRVQVRVLTSGAAKATSACLSVRSSVQPKPFSLTT